MFNNESDKKKAWAMIWMAIGVIAVIYNIFDLTNPAFKALRGSDPVGRTGDFLFIIIGIACVFFSLMTLLGE